MIPIKEERELVSSGAEASIAFSISSKDSVHIMGILRDQLYSDKILAVLREIGANAQDANASAGRRDVPIRVTLPTLEDPTLRIRDSGPGLSLEDVRTVFSQYGASTKRDSNEAVGMLGIGSKSPFAYSDSFMVTSWHGATRSIYNAVIDPSGAGQIDLLDVSPCDASETGVEVAMGVRPRDIPAFYERASRLFIHFDPRPIINMSIPPRGAMRVIRGGEIEECEGPGLGLWVAVMGCIPYDIRLDQLESGPGGSELSRAVHRISGVLHFPVGDLQVAASRESLKYGDSTRRVLIQRLNDAVEQYVALLLEGIESPSMTNWERRLRVGLLARRQLPVPLALRSFLGSVGLSASATVPPPFSFQSRSWNGRNEAVTHLTVSSGVRFVLCDDSRAMMGFKLKPDDIVVKAKGHKDGSELDHLKGFLASIKCDGAPIAMLSSIEWTAPKGSTPRRPYDKERAKTRRFKLDLIALLPNAGRSFQGPHSLLWIPDDDGASDGDVFVVMESYEPIDLNNFYEKVYNESMMARALGLKFPSVIGYRSTKARPIAMKDCLGTRYGEWRLTGLPKLLLSDQRVADAFAAHSYDLRALDAYEMGSVATFISGALGQDHMLSVFCAEYQRCKMALTKATVPVKSAVNFIKATDCRGDDMPGHRAKLEILKRYPLLGAATSCICSMIAGRDDHSRDWIDYIKMVDRVLGETNKEAA